VTTTWNPEINCKTTYKMNTSPETTAQLAKRERNSKWFWVSLICSFFAMDFTIAAIAISMAAGDPSFRSIPGYGERAVAWDVRRQRKEDSLKLGWKVKVQRAEPLRDAIDVTIVKSDNEPVTGCTGSLRLFHYTRVAEQFQRELNEIEPGRYRAKVDVSKLGRWHLEMEIHATGDRDYWDDLTLNWFEVSEKSKGTAE
jgi:nitrogen fixation protein FixH